MYPITFLFCCLVLVFSGTWAMVANRRWVILVTYLAAIISAPIILYARVITDMGALALAMAAYLIFGLLADIFIFQINATKSFLGKIFWNVATASILSLILPVSEGLIRSSIKPVSLILRLFDVEFQLFLYALPLFICLLITSFLGSGLSNILKRLLPNIFEILPINTQKL